MSTSRLNAIPRFGLPYTISDFSAGLSALIRGVPSPVAFDLIDKSPKFWTRSGRQALQLLLTALDLRPESGIALPLFADPSLAAAVVAAGHQPVFIDIDPRTLTMDPKSLNAASGSFAAAVVVHLFGHVADMPALLSAAGDVPVIEDTAHAPLSYLNGRMAGEFGLASFYSFASTKYLPAGGGGLAVVHDPGLAAKMAALVSSLRKPTRSAALWHLILQGSKSVLFSRALYGVIGMPLRRAVEGWALLEPRLDLTAIEPPHAAAAAQQALRFKERVEKQRSNSLRLLARLGTAEEVILPCEPPGTRYNYHLFPVLLRDRSERAAVAAEMWKAFVDTSTIYLGSIQECRRLGYRGGCPVSESVAERLLTLPNHAALSQQEIHTVADVFLSSLRACRANQRRYPVLNLSSQRFGRPADSHDMITRCR